MILKLNRIIWLVLLQIMLILPVVLGATDQIHTVRKGDTLYSLSKKYGTTVDKLLQMNKLQSSNLSLGQKLIVKTGVKAPVPQTLPAVKKPEVKPVQTPQPPLESPETSPGDYSSGDVSPPVENLSDDFYYVIKAKDNLYRVAVNHGISMENLLKWNGFANSSVPIHPGDKVIIKDPSGGMSNPAPPPANKSTFLSTAPATPDTVVIEKVYIVQKKDTLFRIATNNGMTVEELKQLNKLTSNELKVGQRIYLAGKPRPETSTPTTDMLTEDEVQKRDKIRSDLIMPVEGRVISEYGLRNGRPHKGIDLGAKTGTPIFAVADGTVVYSGVQGSYGNVIVIEHPDFVMTVYAHNEKNFVSVNDKVTQGQQIGTVGSTGNAQGSHLHFEYRLKGKAINPRKVLPLN